MFSLHHEYRAGGIMGQSDHTPGEYVDAADVVGADPETAKVIKQVHDRREKFIADSAKQTRQRQVQQARETYHLESRSMVNMYGIGGPGPDPYEEAAKTIRRIYPSDVADEVIGDLGKGGES